ncbi:MAG TPA: helix-turn-helix domain-containing protein, partial [Gemmatimonadaceae bacterium]|nr:helix-turn-helix domain-containing protein [Gemmatimonadaceae bacterium]
MPNSTLDFSKPHVLRNAREYDAAVSEIDTLLDRGRLSREDEDRLEFLTLLVESYDDAHYEMGEGSTPRSVVDFLLEQNDMTRAELAPLMGGRSRVSDFFNGRRSLSLGQIQKLRERFGVSADALIPG